MLQSNITPGIYINELNNFPNAAVGVPTAVPAFVGYTPQAWYEGKSYLNVPVKISSFAEFKAFFCYPDNAAPAAPAKQYSPQYYLEALKTAPTDPDYIIINGTNYAIVADPNTVYYLYNSIKLFYENGGADAYIVSVGTYGAASGNPAAPGAQTINANVLLNELMDGLALLKDEQEPTMYICPEATLLSPADNSTLMEAMLLQNSTVQTAISIFDIIGGRNPDPVLFMNDVTAFREATGAVGLDYGAAYYPFVGTTIIQPGDLDYTNLFGGDIKQLAAIINPAANPDPAVAAIIANIENPAAGTTVAQNNTALMNASSTYTDMLNRIFAIANVLPPSGGMAGVITTTDNASGVWQAPANTSMVGVVSLPINLTDSQQSNLAMDAATGKSINAIRSFPGVGILIWGARTLDGNSNDWRYIQVRRTLIYLEQSIKAALQSFVFLPNEQTTWSAVTAMIGGFLNSVWAQGGLQGGTPKDAYSVACGLGTTMTSEDVLNGFMNVTVEVAVAHPAEFIVLTFQQLLATSN